MSVSSDIYLDSHPNNFLRRFVSLYGERITESKGEDSMPTDPIVGWLMFALGFILALIAVVTKVKFFWERLLVFGACFLMISGAIIVFVPQIK